MGGKGKKKGKKQKQAASVGGAEEGTEENGEANGGKKSKKGKKGKAGKSSKFQGDILSESAMENAYYVCHNLMDVLKVGCLNFYGLFILFKYRFFRLGVLHGQKARRRRKRERNNQREPSNSFLSINQNCFLCGQI